MFVAENFIRSLVEKYGKHTVYTDGGTWYDEACSIIGLKHCLHSSLEKSLIERVNQYFKDRIESFDDYYLCIQKETMNVTYFRYKIEYNSLYHV
jgi:putative transposase